VSGIELVEIRRIFAGSAGLDRLDHRSHRQYGSITGLWIGPRGTIAAGIESA